MRVIHVLRKPVSESTVTANVVKHGTGALNIDASRISTDDNLNGGAYAANPTHRAGEDMWTRDRKGDTNCFRRGEEFAGAYQQPTGRWPANVILQHLDGCEKVCEPGCPVARLDEQIGVTKTTSGASRFYKQVGGKSDG